MRRLTLSLAAAIALLLIAAVAVVTAGPSTDPDDPSSRNAGRGGSLALYTWLHDGLGIETVHRISGTFDLRDLDVLVVHEPTVDLTDADASAVIDFLAGGGELVLTVDRVDVSQASALLDRLRVSAEMSLAAAIAHPAQPFDVGAHVQDVPVADGALALASGPDLVPLLQTGGHPVMAGARVGAGRAYVLGSPYPLSNAGLRADGPQRSDAYALVLAVLERARGGRIGLDEVHHGEGSSATGAAAVLAGPVGAAGGLAAVVVFAYLLLSGRRLGAPLPAGDPSRVPSAGEFVADMARLYERSRVRGAVATRYAEELKQRVGGATGVEPGRDDDGFVGGIAGYGAERAAEVRDVLRRARELAAGNPDDRQLLALARRVDDVERRW